MLNKLCKKLIILILGRFESSRILKLGITSHIEETFGNKDQFYFTHLGIRYDEEVDQAKYPLPFVSKSRLIFCKSAGYFGFAGS
jgi:hypothetical protein